MAPQEASDRFSKDHGFGGDINGGVSGDTGTAHPPALTSDCGIRTGARGNKQVIKRIRRGSRTSRTDKGKRHGSARRGVVYQKGRGERTGLMPDHELRSLSLWRMGTTRRGAKTRRSKAMIQVAALTGRPRSRVLCRRLREAGRREIMGGRDYGSGSK